jgi:2-polyprenyl-3-methyl-5-hydroxy-6-metoxy-1,4-benzoquinol methylase
VPDPDKVVLMALKVWGYKQGEVVSLMIHLGDRLGLYRALDGAGPVTAGELARRTGLNARWLLEWLRGQAAADLVDSRDGEEFELSPEAAALLADEETSFWFAAGAFDGAAAPPEVTSRLTESFRSGAGLSFDDLGPAAARKVERTLGPWSRLALLPTILPALDGVTARLEAGAAVADVGCGSGTTLLTLAAAFPRSRFHGYDPSRYATERAHTNLASRGLANVTFHQESSDDLPSRPAFELVLTFDCLHDMPHPDQAAKAVRRCLTDDGTWLIKKIRAGETWQDNLTLPVPAMFYGSSVTSCLPSGLSEPGGAGLGTLGLPPSALQRMCRDAGFSRVRLHDFADPANLYYEVRPWPGPAGTAPGSRSGASSCPAAQACHILLPSARS